MLLSVLICPVLFAAEHVFSPQSPLLPEFAVSGDFPVGVKTIEVINPKALNLTDFTSITNRKLTLEVWYPAHENGKPSATYQAVTRLHKPFELAGSAHRDAPPRTEGQYPIIIVSHGYTGYRSMMFYLGEHLASHGYIVIAIDHTDSTTGEIDLINAPTAGFVSTLINRASDQQFVLESATQDNFFLNTITDKNNAAVIGYSMGGYGAINTVGGCYDAKAENLVRLGFPEQAATALALLPVFNFCNAGREKPDPRWKAMIGFAPWGQTFNIHQPQALANLSVPTLYVSGEDDDVSGFTDGVEKLFKQTSSTDNFLSVYENARHNIAAHPAPKVAYETEEDLGHYFEPSWNTEQLNRINEHMSLVFLNCYVKQQSTACAYLPQRVNATQILSNDGTLTPPWPGFKPRWATGMRFYRASTH